MASNSQKASELRKAIQLFLGTLDSDTQLSDILSVATVYSKYKVGIAYKAKDIFSYGENSVGDPQLYQVLQDHTSASVWLPNETPGLYKQIGLTEEGYPLWVQPVGTSDAYNLGNKVSYNGELYESTIDANVWAPGVYGWTKIDN